MLSLIIGFTLCVCLLFFIKAAFYPQEKIFLNQATHHAVVISKKEEQELEESVEKFQKNLLWNAPIHKTPLFTSRNYYCKNRVLVDPIEDNTLLHPPVPTQWLLEHNLDYTDPNILSEDPSGDGFTNLEKWQGSDPYKNPGSSSFDPNEPLSRPLLWTKLRCRSNNLHKSSYHFYFLGLEPDSSEVVFLLQSEEEASNRTPENKKTLATKIRHLKLGEELTDIPLKINKFKEEQTINKEIHYDTSTLILINTQTKEEWNLIRKSRLNPNPITIEILDNVSFEYTLESPPQKISLTYGNFFLLESQASPNNPDHKDQEFYQFIRIDGNQAIIEREGHEHGIPILN